MDNTNDVIDINDIWSVRRALEFRFSLNKVQFQDGDEIIVPCIALYDTDTDALICCPCLETWYLYLDEERPKERTTIRRRAINITRFLNYLLHETPILDLSSVNRIILHSFLESCKDVDPDTWSRIKSDVFNFLSVYYCCNQNNDKLTFQYSLTDLLSKTGFLPKNWTNNDEQKYSSLGVKPPKKTKKKNRYFPRDYLPLLLYVCEIYDPMIALAVALCAYAGLRVGEVVNLTWGRIKLINTGFNRIGKIELDITDEAQFAKEWRGTEFGNIKKPRFQNVFQDIVYRVLELLDKH
ncbi:MAG: hypothetical protein E7427_03935, partial [Ruminococcaceae bacterium]|nr:hypothetical protein [Oscillospiraceae bacterium]